MHTRAREEMSTFCCYVPKRRCERVKMKTTAKVRVIDVNKNKKEIERVVT